MKLAGRSTIETMRRCLGYPFTLLLASSLLGQADADTIIFSLSSARTIGGIDADNGDILQYDLETGITTRLFNEGDLLGDSGDVTGVYVHPNGTLVVGIDSGGPSTEIGGLTVRDGDIVNYMSFSNSASLLFDGDLWDGSRKDADIVHLRDNGNLLLATRNGGTLAGVEVERGDIVEYNPTTGAASLFFDHNTFEDALTPSIFAFSQRDNGNLLMIAGTLTTEHTLGGVTFEGAHQLSEYNPATGEASLLFDFATISNTPPGIDAVHYVSAVPEPSARWLACNGLLLTLLGYLAMTWDLLPLGRAKCLNEPVQLNQCGPAIQVPSQRSPGSGRSSATRGSGR